MNSIFRTETTTSAAEGMTATDGRSRMEIARVAKRLWNAAGRPPGRYVEYWAKAEQAAGTCRDSTDLEAERSSSSKSTISHCE